MTGISVYSHVYKNHQALILSMDDRKSVYGQGFHRQEIHSQYKASLVVELMRRHGKCEITWSNGLCVHCYISDQLLVIIRRLANLKRNMTAKIYEEFEAKLDDLDGFEVILAPYLIAEKLTPLEDNLGYDQWIQIDFTKEGCDAKTIKIALSLAFPEIVEYLEECDTWAEEEESNTLHYERDGRHLWEDHKLFEEFSVKEISEKLGCQISVYYEGEEKEDAESIEVVNGEIKSHRTLQWVDVE